MQASWDLACRLSEALGEAGEPLYSSNYRFSTKSLIKDFLIELKLAFQENLQLQCSTLHATFYIQPSRRIAQDDRC